MAWTEHDGTERRAGKDGRIEVGLRAGGVRWLRERLLKVLRRDHVAGLLTMSLDGKLSCQTWGADRCQCDG